MSRLVQIPVNRRITQTPINDVSQKMGCKSRAQERSQLIFIYKGQVFFYVTQNIR